MLKRQHHEYDGREYPKTPAFCWVLHLRPANAYIEVNTAAANAVLPLPNTQGCNFESEL